MRDIKLWRKLSNISAYSCGAVAIIDTFFEKYFKDFNTIIIVFLILTIILFLISTLMKFYIKRKRSI